jgi:hypothetical protein
MPDARGGRWCLLAVGTDRVFGAFDNSFIGLYFKLEISVAIFALQDPRSAVHIYPAFQEADNNFSAFPMYATASEYESIARSSKSLASTSSQRISTMDWPVCDSRLTSGPSGKSRARIPAL